MSKKRLKRNTIQCGNCGDIIQSMGARDFVSCTCGDSFVDGGLDYQRIGMGNKGFIDLSVWEDDKKEKGK
jgi:hypothetical protein